MTRQHIAYTPLEVSYGMDIPKHLLEEWEREDREAREIRRKMANWDFINKQPPRIRAALIHFIETGDLWVASRIAGLTVDEFNELRIKANIPVVA